MESHSDLIVVILLLDSSVHSYHSPPTVQPACVHGSVRLVGGTERDGAVQVCVFGVWGPLSSYNWRFREARVVCRALGYDEFGENDVIHVETLFS